MRSRQVKRQAAVKAFKRGQRVSGKAAEAYAQQARQVSGFKQAKRSAAARKGAATRAARRREAGFKANDPEKQARSPYFVMGTEDGQRDCLIVAACPPGSPWGPDPEKAWSWMYKKGYSQAWALAMPHRCTAACRRQGST